MTQTSQTPGNNARARTAPAQSPLNAGAVRKPIKFEYMKCAFADPPYLGCGKLYDNDHPQSRDWDDPLTHKALVERLCGEFPDGWALCCSSPTFPTIRAMCPADVRTGIWIKPFASFKPNVNPAYAYEPVIFCGGRKRTREQETIRDWVSCNITLQRGLTGAKPRDFCRWVIAFLNLHQSDDLVDLFPGTGAMKAAWNDWCAGTSHPQQVALDFQE